MCKYPKDICFLKKLIGPKGTPPKKMVKEIKIDNCQNVEKKGSWIFHSSLAWQVYPMANGRY